jgi:hypothetical protein
MNKIENTINRLESEIYMPGDDNNNINILVTTSIAISLKRIADNLSRIEGQLAQLRTYPVKY